MSADGVTYGTDEAAGIRRRGHRRFAYVDERTGRRPGSAELARIDALAIPPAWTEVWIAADPHSHVQATGRDAKGRKVYRYHPDFVRRRARAKFAGLADFGKGLGPLRRRARADLRGGTPSYETVVAAIVTLLDDTFLRVGNEEYAATNGSFGLTTLRNRHVQVQRGSARLRFVGKSSQRFDVLVDDAAVVRVIRRCHELPGQLLFEYLDDDGEVRRIGSADVNRYVRRFTGDTASAKSFRTWGASARAGTLLAGLEGPPSATALNGALREVAGMLGNTLAVCRASYVHPRVVAGYLDGSLPERWAPPPPATPRGLSADERRLLRLIG